MEGRGNRGTRGQRHEGTEAQAPGAKSEGCCNVAFALLFATAAGWDITGGRGTHWDCDQNRVVFYFGLVYPNIAFQ